MRVELLIIRCQCVFGLTTPRYVRRTLSTSTNRTSNQQDDSLHGTGLCCSVPFRTLLRRFAMFCPILFCSILIRTDLYCSVLFLTAVLFRTFLHASVVFGTALCCSLLFRTILYVRYSAALLSAVKSYISYTTPQLYPVAALLSYTLLTTAFQGMLRDENKKQKGVKGSI